jgi:hypothetical protein
VPRNRLVVQLEQLVMAVVTLDLVVQSNDGLLLSSDKLDEALCLLGLKQEH